MAAGELLKYAASGSNGFGNLRAYHSWHSLLPNEREERETVEREREGGG